MGRLTLHTDESGVWLGRVVQDALADRGLAAAGAGGGVRGGGQGYVGAVVVRFDGAGARGVERGVEGVEVGADVLDWLG